MLHSPFRAGGRRAVGRAVPALLALAGLIALGLPAGPAAAAPLPRPRPINPGRNQAIVTVTLSMNTLTAPLTPGAPFIWYLAVANDGPRGASDVRVDLTLDPNVVVDNFSANHAGIYVDSLSATDLTIRFGDMYAKQTERAQVAVHVAPGAPANATLTASATMTWLYKDSLNTGQSNTLTVPLGSLGLAGGAGAAAPPGLAVAPAGPVPAGTALTFTGGAYTPGERIGLWLNVPYDTTPAPTWLGQTDTHLSGLVIPIDAPAFADATGGVSIPLNTSGLPPGSYALVAAGVSSGLQTVTPFTIR